MRARESRGRIRREKKLKYGVPCMTTCPGKDSVLHQSVTLMPCPCGLLIVLDKEGREGAKSSR